jgi:hypothetical protein
MVVKIPKKLEMKSLLPAPCFPLPAHVLAFPSGEEWDKEKRKPGYSKWMEDKLVDALYNLQPVLDRYMRLQTVPMNNEELAAFRNKVDHFCDIPKNWSKKSQKSSTTWQQGTATEMMLRFCEVAT